MADKNKYETLVHVITELYPSMTDYQKEKLEGVCPELAESEDEKIRKAIITYLTNDLNNVKQVTPRTNEYEGWIAWLERQKPVEWSEEDTAKMSALSRWLCSNNNSKFDGFRAFELVDWLKTLRPQNHWKPTKEQVKVCSKCGAKMLKTGSITKSIPIKYEYKCEGCGCLEYDEKNYG